MWSLSRGFKVDLGGNRREGCWNKGVGEMFQVIVRPVAGSGSVSLQFGAEKRTLTQTERVTLPPIHWVVLVVYKQVLKTPPDQTKDGVVQRRCHSVQMHTNGDSRPYLPSSLHTSRLQLTLVFPIHTNHGDMSVCHLHFTELNSWLLMFWSTLLLNVCH